MGFLGRWFHRSPLTLDPAPTPRVCKENVLACGTSGRCLMRLEESASLFHNWLCAGRGVMPIGWRTAPPQVGALTSLGATTIGAVHTVINFDITHVITRVRRRLQILIAIGFYIAAPVSGIRHSTLLTKSRVKERSGERSLSIFARLEYEFWFSRTTVSTHGRNAEGCNVLEYTTKLPMKHGFVSS